ncbi:hypothetical protein FMUND_13134 [Fusarium mundagurra]|uniref:Chromo domain-containing protein n=1 Tax=Fusarium mundagurra TaxID=1567541 RepID=A0A8H6D590_9HYPO|nr:hypothetical protein FMUND_13134 [Fusarium mundagurra]
MVPVSLTDEIYDQDDKVPPNQNKETSSSHNWQSKQCTVDSLIGHKLDKKTSTVEFIVKWANGKTTIQPEWTLQPDIPALIYEYWEKVGGRQEATRFTFDHVFRILDVKVTDGKKEYKVQWVGYPDVRPWTTWEDERKLRRIARVELEIFQNQPVKKRE